ncbi:MAG: HYR domain-containing protein, partial [Methanomicrobiales archaeon]|nr:HYR domain-containing protein [Methanomicrobiales archaeon]
TDGNSDNNDASGWDAVPITVVLDTIPPEITCPSDVTVNTDAGVCSATGVDLGSPTVSDKYDPAPAVANDAPAPFPKGTTTVTWTATDGAGNSASCTQTVTVTDNEAPVITCPIDLTVNTDPGVCYAAGVILGSPAVSDNCDPAPTVTNDASAQFPKGTTPVTWTATDDAGNSASCTQTVTVEDNEAPVITVTVSPDTLWPPNHKYGDVTATVTVADNCGSPTIAFVSATSNEPDDAKGGGDGNTVNDIVNVDNYHFKLRAERDGDRTGRVYTITYQVTDTSENSALASATVKVPLDLP